MSLPGSHRRGTHAKLETAAHARTSVREVDTTEMDKKATGFTTSPVDYIYEQPPEELLRDLLPRYVYTPLFRGRLESEAAEHAARMTAMDSATATLLTSIRFAHAGHEPGPPGESCRRDY